MKPLVLVVLVVSLACAGPTPTESPDPLGVSEQPPEPELVSRSVRNELTYRNGDPPEVSTWSRGDTLFLGVDLANLREAPDADAPIVATLRAGSRLVVLEPSSELVAVQGRTNRWYHVAFGKEEGHVFGAILTPVVADWNLIGRDFPENVTVTFSPEFAPRLRVTEDWRDEAEPRSVGLDLSFPNQRAGGTVSFSRVPVGPNPFSLVSVTLCDPPNVCDERLVGYVASGGELGKLVPVSGKSAKLTPLWGGFRFGSGPIHRLAADGFLTEPCAECVGHVPVVPTQPEDVLVITLLSGERGPDTVMTCRAIGTLTEGDYRRKSLISCAVPHEERWDHSWDPPTTNLYRFVRQSPTTWALLTQMSDLDTGWGDEPDTVRRRLAEEHAIEVVDDGVTLLAGMVEPEVLLEGPWGRIVRRHHGLGADPYDFAFVHPVAGPVHTLFETTDHMEYDAGFWLRTLDGPEVVYSYEPPDWSDVTLTGSSDPRGGATYQPHFTNCGARGVGCVSAADFDGEGLQAFATTRWGDSLYVLPTAGHRLNSGLEDLDGVAITADSVPTPAVYWKDPFGRWIRFVRSDLTDGNCD